jgi:predicted DNA-binding transcriptional regulator AlpA
MEPRRYLDTRQAAEYMGFSASWLAHARLRDEGPAFIQIPGSKIVKYDIRDIDDWMSSCRSPMGRPMEIPAAAIAPRRRGRPTKAETVVRRRGASVFLER